MRQIRCCLSPYCTAAGNEKYFRIPKVKDGPISQVTKNLNQRRRLLWLNALGLTEAAMESKHIFVCSRHFISGKPACETFENDVDWIPTVRVPVPKSIFIPPPTEEHSYCQMSVRNSNVQKGKMSASDCPTARHIFPGIVRRCSRRLPIVKKKREKAIERAAKAQQLADAYRKKIEEKLKEKKKLKMKKAKRLEKLKRAEMQATYLGEADENNENPIQSRSIDLHKPNDKLHASREPKSMGTGEKPNALGNDSIPRRAREANVIKAPVVAISMTLGSKQMVRLPKGLQQLEVVSSTSGVVSKDPLASQAIPVPVASPRIISSAAKSTSKNKILKHFALNQILPIPNLTYVGKAMPLRLAPNITNKNGPQMSDEPLKIVPSHVNDHNPLKTPRPIIVGDPSETPPGNVKHAIQKELQKPSPQSGQVKLLQNLRLAQDRIRDLMLKKNPTLDDTSLSFHMLNLIEHRRSILGTEPQGSTLPILNRSDSQVPKPTSLSSTDHSCEYILPDDTVSDICSSCGRHSSSAYVDFLKSQVEHKSNLVKSCTNQLVNVRKELNEAKQYIDNLSAQLQKNTLTLCSFLAANPPEALKKEK